MRSIRARLLVMLLCGAMVLLLVGGGVVYAIARAGLVRQFDDVLDARAHTIAALVKVEPCRRTPGGPIAGCNVLELGDAPAATMRETFFVIWDEEGRVAKRSDNLGSVILPPEAVTEADMDFGDVELPDGLPGRCVWYAFRPRVDPDDWEGLDMALADPQLMLVGAALDRRPLDRAHHRVLIALLIADAGIGAALALLLVLGIRWGLRPLERLRAELETVEGDTLSRRFVGSNAPSELAPVYRELNRMLDRVEQTLQRERTFADAAAHELRTPLAELRSLAEVALRWPDTKRADAALHEALAIGGEMERLVESLLRISRGQAGAVADDAGEARVEQIVRGCLDHRAKSIASKNLTLTVELNGTEPWPAPADAVEIIVRNLIDNAVQYTPATGCISIRDAHADNGTVGLVFENGPVDLSADDVPHLFEPFWRRERSRADRRHAGLGLAVVDHVARAVGLRMEAEMVGNRLRIRVTNGH